MKRIGTMILTIILAVSLFSGCAVIKREPEKLPRIENVYIPTNAETVMRDEIREPNGTVSLNASLAKNEAEGMQFILNFDEDKKNVKVTLSEFKDDNGNMIAAENITLYRQHYVEVDENSIQGLKPGYYPDALIPMFDDLNRVDIEAGNNQGYWITVKAPKEQAAGIYKGEVSVEYDGGSIKIPSEVEVWDFELPTEPSFMTSYGLWFGMVWGIHERNNATEGITYNELFEDYYWFLTDYRVTPNALPVSGNTPEEFVQNTERFFRDPRVSAVNLPYWYSRDENGDIVHNDNNNRLIELLEEKGLLDKAYYYLGGLIDEPADTEAMNRLVKSACDDIRSYTDIPHMVTTAPRASLEGVVDGWCPLWNKIDEETVRKHQSAGDTVWWYGCVTPKNPYPTYHLDDRLMSSRLIHWMQKDYNVTGNLYWATTVFQKYNGVEYVDRDVWTDPDSYPGAPGDGYLLYPGTENDGYVNRNMPIPTIRLESIRDGSEDYEYLVILENKITELLNKWGITEITADEYMDTYYTALYNDTDKFDTDPERIQQMRKIIANDIMSEEECIIAVLPYAGSECTNGREVRVYAPSASKVTIAGEEITGEEKAGYSVYTKVISTKYDYLKDVEITVNGSEFTRKLLKLQDYEYYELVEKKALSNAKELKLPYTDEEITANAVFNTHDSEFEIDSDIVTAAMIRELIAKEQSSSIPSVVMSYEKTFGKDISYKYDVVIYAPSDSTLKVDGEEVEVSKKTESYNVFEFEVYCKDARKYFFETVLTSKGKTETQTRVIFRNVAKASQLLDFSDKKVEEVIEAVAGNKRSNYEIKTEESGKSILSVTFNKEMRRFVINSEAFMDGLKQFTGYTHIRFEITNTSEDYQDGLNVMLTAGAANIPLGYAGDFAPGETRLVTYDLPDILINENAPRDVKSVRLNSSDDASYEIRSISVIEKEK